MYSYKLVVYLHNESKNTCPRAWNYGWTSYIFPSFLANTITLFRHNVWPFKKVCDHIQFIPILQITFKVALVGLSFRFHNTLYNVMIYCKICIHCSNVWPYFQNVWTFLDLIRHFVRTAVNYNFRLCCPCWQSYKS